jgi:hypothetical protein
MEASKGLLAVSPNVDCPFYYSTNLESVAEAVATAALRDLNNLKHMISYLLYHIYYITLKKKNVLYYISSNLYDTLYDMNTK